VRYQHANKKSAHATTRHHLVIPMPVFVLGPRNGDTSDPRWQASSVKERCWTQAENQDVARRRVEDATFERVDAPGPKVASSPWTDPQLTYCNIDPTPPPVPAQSVLSEGGIVIATVEGADTSV
jgi:hypothetical protein